MLITITSGATTQTLCHGIAQRGQSGYMLGPLGLEGLDMAWSVILKRPIRAAVATPMQRGLREGRFAFGIYRHFESLDAAHQWAYHTFPEALITAGSLAISVVTDKRARLSDAALERLTIAPAGITVDVRMTWRYGAVTFEDDT